MASGPRQVVFVGAATAVAEWRTLAQRSPLLTVAGSVVVDPMQAAAAQVAHLADSEVDIVVVGPPRMVAETGAALDDLGAPVVLAMPPEHSARQWRHARFAPSLIGLAATTWLDKAGGRQLDITWPGPLIEGAALAMSSAASLQVAHVDPTTNSVQLRDSAGRTIALHRRVGGTTRLEHAASRYDFDGTSETVRTGATDKSRDVPPHPQRALAALARHPSALISAEQLTAASSLVAGMRDLGPNMATVGLAQLARSAELAVAAADEREQLRALGLRADAPLNKGSSRHISDPAELPVEAWAYRAGVKPVAFMTVRPDQVDAMVALFDGAHTVQRQRRVRVHAQDRWTDDRSSGEPMVELYLSRDPAKAERAAALQADADPSAHAGELGRLMGYPACCVDAWANQHDRANNTYNRYLAASRTAAGGPWAWQLNDLHAKLVPFYPCHYRCTAAVAFADAALTAMDDAEPGKAARWQRLLARPVLYFDHDHQLWFDGTSDGGRIAYQAVEYAGTSRGIAALAGHCATSTELTVTAMAIGDLARIDPGLGFVAPFGLSR